MKSKCILNVDDLEIGKTYLLRLSGYPYINSNWVDNFILLDFSVDGILTLFNIKLNKEFYVSKFLVKVYNIVDI